MPTRSLAGLLAMASERRATPTLGELAPGATDRLPLRRGLFYGGGWHEPHGGWSDSTSPIIGESPGRCAEADAADVDRAVTSALAGFAAWKQVPLVERGRILCGMVAFTRLKNVHTSL